MALAVAALAACGPAQSPQVPSPPPDLAQPAEYAFGDAVAAADSAAIGHVADLLQAGGRPEVTRYAAASGTDFAKLEAYYDVRAAAGGWEPLADLGRSLPPGERAIGYRAGNSAFAVVWLAPRAGSGFVPVNVIRFR
ncbi:MAG: hypothetical protein MT490_00480 [Sphingomonas sp.]|uniref:hypothetical protein n=1 Tax=Sphingomonas sp. TaxID=28214 RepID=UPI002274B848|nr:hypothetical protein [Sphingomonas sp.]MCX8474245.1 hypothetical protein [Sphingomonas sp.]